MKDLVWAQKTPQYQEFLNLLFENGLLTKEDAAKYCRAAQSYIAKHPWLSLYYPDEVARYLLNGLFPRREDRQ